MRAFRVVFLLLSCIWLSPDVAAQFQKKFTIDVGVSPLLPSKEALRPDRLPFLFSNFEYGYGTYTNLLYNLTRKFSVGAAASLSTFRSWKDPRTESTGDNSYFNIYSFDPNIKYKIIARKISPFLMAGLGVSVYHAKRAQSTLLLENFYPVDFQTEDDSGYPPDYFSIDNVLIREPGFEVKPKAAFNVLGAAGVDIKISESLGITLMACYNMSFTSGNFTLAQNLRYLSFPVGVNLSIGKSKTL